MSKGRPEIQPYSLVWVVLSTVVLCMFVIGVANAQHDIDMRQSNDMNTATGNVLGGDAIGIGFSSPSFTAAISQCIATESENWAFGAYGKQKVVPNYHCMGLAYLRSGMILAGEFILCKHTELSEMPDCEAAVKQFTLLVSKPPSTEGGAIESAFMDQHVKTEDMLAAEVEKYQMQMTDMQMIISDLQVQAATAPALKEQSDAAALRRQNARKALEVSQE